MPCTCDGLSAAAGESPRTYDRPQPAPAQTHPPGPEGRPRNDTLWVPWVLTVLADRVSRYVKASQERSVSATTYGAS